MAKKNTIEFATTLHRFEEKGEKSGWTFLEVSPEMANRLFPGNKKIFQVKGSIDSLSVAGVSLLPMGGGNFILPINTAMRKALRKKAGAMVELHLQRDEKKYTLNKDLMICLKEAPDAFTYFKGLPPSQQNYFSKWVDAAKTDATRIKRIGRCLYGLMHKMDYGAMIRYFKKMDNL